MTIVIEEDDLLHYGIIRRSGRYPWGSGKDENTHNKMFLDHVSELKAQGQSESDIAKGFDMTVTQLRAEKTIAKNQQKQAQIAMAQRLQNKGYSTNAIAKRMQIPESTARTLLAPGAKDKADVLTSTANALRKRVDEVTYLDVGRGTENQVGISKTKLETATQMLKMEGYEVHNVPIPQITNINQKTTAKVLCPPGTTQKEVWENQGKIQAFKMFSEDFGRNYYGLHPPIQINPDRVEVIWNEDGGKERDGVVFVRPGKEDLSLGGKNYAQVRIAIGDKHFIKGMAVVNSDLPEGVDLQFHTNKFKKNAKSKLDAFKSIEEDADPQNPFKAVINQIVVDHGQKTERVTSAMNIVYEEGDWAEWNRTLSSQMLSKQDPKLIKSQLDFTKDKRQRSLDEISALTNPTVRKKLLYDFAESTDSASAHLKAAALPRQATHVILPLSTMKPTEIYAPNYKSGEKVVLIRHPHGGVFEIPELTVNNRNPEGRKFIGNKAMDAIGIHHSVAAWLSGADFDGDTVLVIPNEKGPLLIKHEKPLEGLKDFDPIASYPGYPGMKPLRATGNEMGKISNLITDMTLLGASHEELSRAIRHSMVVIDAEKHNLDYRLSANDNGIKQLKEKYQTGGASTLLSRAGAKIRPVERKLRGRTQGGPVDLKTGAKVWVPTGAIYKTGPNAGEPKRFKIERLAYETDATKLISNSNTQIERMYADYSNDLKHMANGARLASEKTPRSRYSSSANKVYAKEVASLNAKLETAKAKAPLERQAQIYARKIVSMQRAANPNMSKETRNKIQQQALDAARNRFGSKKTRIEITKTEWDAIQAGAISDTKLTDILTNANMDTVHKLAMPKTTILMSPSMINRAKSMYASGYTTKQVADHLGVSLSTLKDSVQKGEE